MRAPIPICTRTCWRSQRVLLVRRRADQQRHRDASAGALAVPRRHCRAQTQSFSVHPADGLARAGVTTCAVLVAGLAGSRDIYRVGFGKPLDDIGERWVDAVARSAHAAHVGNAPCQEIVTIGSDLDATEWARRLAGADLDAGLGQRALSVGRALHHQGPRHRHPEHRQLPRPDQERRAGWG